MSRPVPEPPVRAALGGVGEHVVAPLLVGLLLRGVVAGVDRAHDELLLVLDHDVAVATSLVRVGDMLDTRRGDVEDRLHIALSIEDHFGDSNWSR